MMKKKIFRTTSLVLIALALAGCSTFKGFFSAKDPTQGWSAQKLYEQAREDVRAGQWKSARTNLEFIQQRYPFSSFAQQAMIDDAYVNWKDDDADAATTTIDRFLQFYPNHPSTDYMLYLKGLVTFTPPSAFLNSYTGQDPSERDPKGLRQSYIAFKQLVDNYPDSRYTPDARQRMAWLVTTIADHETGVATYYYKRQAYIAAINRAQTVIRDFTGVKAAEKALFIMMQSYNKLGLTEQSNDAKRVLDQNFPNSKFYKQGLDKQLPWYSTAAWFN